MWTSYEKMAESTVDFGVLPKPVLKAKWVVLEKVHGANFSFILTENSFQIAKRTEILEEDDNFFGYKNTNLIQNLEQSLKEAFVAIKGQYPNVEAVTIYGELFGGVYEHPNITSIPGVIPVQREIQYSPNLHFKAFDILVIANQGEKKYLDYDVAMKIFEDFKIDYMKPLFIGAMEKALHYSIDFETTIPKSLGLPPLEKRNQAEGVVVKPIKDFWIDSKKGKKRVIVKIKNSEFLETKSLQSKEDRVTWEKGKEKNRNQNFGELEMMKMEIQLLITENRLLSTISKVGAIEPLSSSKQSNRGKIEKILFKEVLDEAKQLFEADKLQNKELNDWLENEIKNLILEHQNSQ